MGGGDAFGKARSARGHGGPRKGLRDNHSELRNMRRLETCMNAVLQDHGKNGRGKKRGVKNVAAKDVLSGAFARRVGEERRLAM